ncbi:MAG: polysaccharide pyruvyl transferase family protein [Clostridium sp.]|jgi:hypothetical protein|nr:polysaccharide pyruvyl transferase family protein [Clostridium sp.]
MDNRIGLITFHSSYNCGSMLQAYALQQVLNNIPNSNNELINFVGEGQKRFYSILVKPKNIKEIIKNIMFGIFYKKINSNYEDYRKFINEYLNLSEKEYSSTEELEKSHLDYNILICGSDQVWNTKCLDFEDAYFLSFKNNVKKIAYATSMAANNIIGQGKEIENRYRKYLMDFDNISVRERNAKLWLEELVGRKIDITADPTLLISSDEWSKLAFPKIEEEYIFYYSMWYTKEINKEIQKISKKYNMPVYVIDAKEWVRRGLWNYGFKLAPNGGPRMFLSLIKDAKLVFTSSFHGTVFASIFKRNFWYIKSNIANSNDDRASFILEQLGLEEKLITKEKIQVIDLWEKVDFIEVHKKIDALKEYSNKYLYESLEEEYNKEKKVIKDENK